MVKRILIASAAFYPENSPRSFRATELARELARQGHHVSVISIDTPPTRHWCEQYNVTFKPLRRLRFPNIASGSGWVGVVRRIVKRVLLMLFEYPEIEYALRFKEALKGEAGYDLLISVAAPYPVHWGVAWVQGSSHAIAKSWIADCGDPYMGNQSDSFRRLPYFGLVEKWLFRRVDFITIPIEAARAAYYPEFTGKIHVIPQGMNFEEMRQACVVYTPNDVVTFGYAGSFIPGKRDPRRFLEYLLTLKTEFRFHIFTNMQDWLLQYVERSNGRIICAPYIPRAELIKKLSSMDFVVNVDNSTTTQAPSKLIDYYVCGRPILSVQSDMQNFAIVDQFLSGNFENQLVLQDYESYRIEKVARQFVELQ